MTASTLKFAAFPFFWGGGLADPDWIGPFARLADELGYESLLFPEHAVVATDYEHRYPYSNDGEAPIAYDTPFPDPLHVMTFVAGITTRIRLGTAVLVLPNHHPVMLAKQLATIDQLSGGRVGLSIGVGWMKEEIQTFGVDYHTRGRYVDESIDLMQALWADSGEAGTSFDGNFHKVRGLHVYPKPKQAGGVPLHIGGHSDAAARRAGRRGDGFHPLGVEGDRLDELLGIMREEAKLAGRDPDSLEVTVGGSFATFDETIAEAERVGAQRVMLASTSPDLKTSLDQLRGARPS